MTTILLDDENHDGVPDILDVPVPTVGEETWKTVFALAPREISEVEFAKMYVAKFDHGTAGHNQFHLIEHMDSILETLFETNTELLAENERLVEMLRSEGYNVESIKQAMQAEIDLLRTQVDSQTSTLMTLKDTMPQVVGDKSILDRLVDSNARNAIDLFEFQHPKDPPKETENTST